MSKYSKILQVLQQKYVQCTVKEEEVKMDRDKQGSV